MTPSAVAMVMMTMPVALHTASDFISDTVLLLGHDEHEQTGDQQSQKKTLHLSRDCFRKAKAMLIRNKTTGAFIVRHGSAFLKQSLER